MNATQIREQNSKRPDRDGELNFGLFHNNPCSEYRGIPHRGLQRHVWVTNTDGSRNATREIYNHTTTLRPAVDGRCPESHPDLIPGSAGCCAERLAGRQTYERIPEQTRVEKRGGGGLDGDGGGGSKRGRDDDDAMTNFGKKKKTRSFQSFRKAYKKKNPSVSDHKVLTKYLAGLIRLRQMY
jgi:hypothetical protein